MAYHNIIEQDAQVNTKFEEQFRLKLRPYQEECLFAMQDNFQNGIRRQLIHLPTGAGKTVVFANLIKNRSCKTLVLAHTCELLEQAKEKIQMICPGLEVGLVNGQNKQFEAPVVISSIQAANQTSNLYRLVEQDFTLCIADECHHFAAETPRKVLSALGFGEGTNKFLVGFTATPFRSDRKGLAEVFDEIVYQKTIREMIEEGYLCKPKGMKIATDLDLSEIKTANGDFHATSLAQVMDTPEINQIAVDSYLKNASGLQTICFGVSIQHAKNLAEHFQKSNVKASAIHGDMSKEERATILAQYRERKIQVLCNCQVLTEGFDAPETSCVIVARPTKSKSLYQQMIGRGLRIWPNKTECIVLDFSDKNHSICSTAILLHDAECENQIDNEEEGVKKELEEKLPTNLNKKLKAAIIHIDMFGETFSWEKSNGSYFMKGSCDRKLAIIPLANTDFFNVVLINSKGDQIIAVDLTFEYAFSAAEDFAKANRTIFTVSDLEASWRDEPISEKQLAFIRSCGYRAGIGSLTKGQASLLIGSGALNRRAG